MMEVFTRHDESRNPKIFDQMYRQRYDIYVKRRRWEGIGVDGKFDIDQYDNDDAVYLLALDEEAGVRAGLRLLPTTRPHIFGDLFPHLAGSHEVPVGDDIMELTRFYVAPFGSNRHQRWWFSGIISIGMFEYCLHNGIRQVSSVIDTFLLPQMLESGWKVRPLGLPEDYGQGMAVGVLIDVEEEAIENTRRTRGVEGAVLYDDHHLVERIPTHMIRSKSQAPSYVGTV